RIYSSAYTAFIATVESRLDQGDFAVTDEINACCGDALAMQRCTPLAMRASSTACLDFSAPLVPSPIPPNSARLLVRQVVRKPTLSVYFTQCRGGRCDASLSRSGAGTGRHGDLSFRNLRAGSRHRQRQPGSPEQLG